jgi:quinol monooxygenase YgiN
MTMRLKPGKGEDDLAALGKEIESIDEPGSGVVRSTIMRDQKDPSRIIVLAVFESEEKARARERDPRRERAMTTARAMMAETFDAAPDFVDLDVVQESAP